MTIQSSQPLREYENSNCERWIGTIDSLDIILCWAIEVNVLGTLRRPQFKKSQTSSHYGKGIILGIGTTTPTTLLKPHQKFFPAALNEEKNLCPALNHATGLNL
jgi:hypothetical protein